MAMDPSRSTGRRGGGGKGGRASRLGMKTGLSPAPPASSPPPTFPSAPPPPPSSSPAPAPPSSSPAPAPAAFSSSPPQGVGVTSRPVQGVALGAMPPNFPYEQGNQQAPNLWSVCPPGGFMNFLQRPQYPSHPHMQEENFHFVGQTMNFNPISPSNAYGAVISQTVKQGTSAKEPVHINIEEVENSEANIAVKKRYWTHDEETRLASAWLNVSKDPIRGNDQKYETFWKEITEEFNRKGNGKRRRELNQLKVHWSRLKSSITDFNDAWTKITQMHTSGYSDDMLEEEAQKVYENRFGKRFSLVHWWKILKEEPKWCAQFEEKEKGKTEIVDILEEQMRPIGRDSAKAERSGKRKKAKMEDGIVNLGDTVEKLVKVQEDRKMEFEKATEAQLKISDANLKAAKEEKEGRMFQVYNTLLNKDTTNMSEAQKANHERAIHKLEEKLFAD